MATDAARLCHVIRFVISRLARCVVLLSLNCTARSLLAISHMYGISSQSLTCAQKLSSFSPCRATYGFSRTRCEALLSFIFHSLARLRAKLKVLSLSLTLVSRYQSGVQLTDRSPAARLAHQRRAPICVTDRPSD